MSICAACGQDNPDIARFCLACGAPLAEAPAADLREERKVVSVLFCDLVGFTSRSESMDVEDVRGTLQPYHALLRRELERHGGTVEKFIGDAVMAVFGAPVAHEDDPERAVRAALAIIDAVAALRDRDARLDLHVRIGVNTGEALIALGADPSRGEGMASGDVVNTAARLESAGPADGVLVGEVTYRATNRAISYEPAEPVAAKGKSEPVPAWRAVQARSRFGTDVEQSSATAMVGRERELDTLRDAAERAFAEREVQLVTVVGVPGIGKSRLVWELSQWVDERPELVRWRQGRCLPYGDGVTWWALGEAVKAEAGILESDGSAAAAEKIGEMVAGAVGDDRDAGWVRGHVAALVGVDGAGDGGSGDPAEAFAAWRRLLEGLAARGPMVLVFEDMHWADDAMLDFVDHLVEWAGEVPLLVVCSARPELLERRRDWGGGKPNAATVALRPLSDEDTRELVSTLLAETLLPAETQAALLERAEGNPLYAEEFVRMLADQGVQASSVLPESVQGIIAARLDALAADEKQLLQDAAVVGKVAWLGALEAIGGGQRWQLEELLHRLVRKEFLRRAQRSSVEGDVEYVFRHVLVRDVAYNQIPRAQRARKHELAAAWIEQLSADRDDAVEMRAHHLVRALEYAEAAGQDTAALRSAARLALRAAGDRAHRVDAHEAAVRHRRAALELTAEDDPDRGYVVLDLARSLARLGVDCEPELEAAIELLLPRDRAAAAHAHTILSGVRSSHGDGEGRQRHVQRALDLVEDAPVSIYHARVLLNCAMNAVVNTEMPEAIRLLDAYLAIAEQAGVEPRDIFTAHAYRGGARVECGDPGGLDEESQAIQGMRELGDSELSISLGNHATVHLILGHVERYRELVAESLEWGLRRTPWRIGGPTAEVAVSEYLAGAWPDALARMSAFVESRGGYGGEFASFVLGTQARILARRGALDEAAEIESAGAATGAGGGHAAVAVPGTGGIRLAGAAARRLCAGRGAAGRVVRPGAGRQRAGGRASLCGRRAGRERRARGASCTVGCRRPRDSAGDAVEGCAAGIGGRRSRRGGEDLRRDRLAPRRRLRAPAGGRAADRPRVRRRGGAASAGGAPFLRIGRRRALSRSGGAAGARPAEGAPRLVFVNCPACKRAPPAASRTRRASACAGCAAPRWRRLPRAASCARWCRCCSVIWLASPARS